MGDSTVDYFMKIFEDSLKKVGTLGSYQIFIVIILSFLFLGMKKEFLVLFIGIIMLYAFAVPIRLIFFKERPIPKRFNDIFGRISASSIPSLHSARSVYLLLFFIYLTQFHILFTFFISSLELLIIFSRVYFKKHYTIDVIVGILLGIFCYFATNIIIEILFVI